MTTSVAFDKSLIAPCGINCGTCLANLRVKKVDLPKLWGNFKRPQ